VSGAQVSLRFWGNVLIGDGCWEWTGFLVEGYGCYGNGKTRLAHRLAYISEVGDIPDGLVLDHLCRNTKCVRPSHLEPVTSAENTRRSPFANKKNCPRGHPYTSVDKQAGLRRIVYKVCKTCRGYRDTAP